MNKLFSRIYCPAHCKDEPSYWAPVFGTNVYADVSMLRSLMTPYIATSISQSRGRTLRFREGSQNLRRRCDLGMG